MTRAQIPLLRPTVPVVLGVAIVAAVAPMAGRLWPFVVPVGLAVIALDAALTLRRSPWAVCLWPIAGRMRTTRNSGLQLHFELEWYGLVREWSLAEAFARELRHLGDAWFGFRLRGRADVYLLRFPESVVRVTSGFGGMAWAPRRLVVLPAEPLGELPRIVRHEFAHLLIPKLGPDSPPFKTEGLCVFLQEIGAGTPAEFGPWPLVLGRPVAELPPIRTMLDPAFFFDRANVGGCYGAAGSFTFYLVTRFGWPAYRQFFRNAHARNYPKAFAAAFGASLAEAEADWRAGLWATVREETGEETDVD